MLTFIPLSVSRSAFSAISFAGFIPQFIIIVSVSSSQPIGGFTITPLKTMMDCILTHLLYKPTGDPRKVEFLETTGVLPRVTSAKDRNGTPLSNISARGTFTKGTLMFSFDNESLDDKYSLNLDVFHRLRITLVLGFNVISLVSWMFTATIRPQGPHLAN